MDFIRSVSYAMDPAKAAMCSNEPLTYLFHPRGGVVLALGCSLARKLHSLRILAVANTNSGNFLSGQPANCPRNGTSTWIALRWPPGG